MGLVSTLLSLLVAGSLTPSPRPAQSDLFAQIYAQAAAKREALHSIHARFTEITTSTLLARPLVAHGSLVAAPPARVLMVYTDPEPRTLLLDGRSLLITWPGRPEQEKLDIATVQRRIDHYFAEASVDQLRSLFEIRAQPDTKVGEAYLIDMRPKRKEIRQGLERLQLWMNRQSLLLMRMQMTFPGGDEKTVALDDIEVNLPVTDETFRPRP